MWNTPSSQRKPLQRPENVYLRCSPRVGPRDHTLRQACPRSNIVGDGPANTRPFHHRRDSPCRELMGAQRMPMVNSGGAPGFFGQSLGFFSSLGCFAGFLCSLEFARCLNRGGREEQLSIGTI
ncbi:hypothetical protein L226DRAFT_353992 [Lentinus tigrinus ALCF2SS1-7]|uniref:uncharacterized protein n=1 Tax=Lentinus tigrinus ALCF2SS1-7 TaxID=1328758 RepID=UPI001165E597|nr:hypothetical protein L226DRAFT_353992 [Lentinus tigrinus ALCF2SS1-7]